MTSLRDSVDTLASSMETLTDNMEKLSSRVSLIESGIQFIILTQIHSLPQFAVSSYPLGQFQVCSNCGFDTVITICVSTLP